jgi:DNA polymerase elongation subunit (family B)
MKLLKEIIGIKTFEELEKVYTVIKENCYKNKKCEIIFDYEMKEYKIEIFDKKENDTKKEIDINVNCDVIYGDTDSIMIKMEYSRLDWKKNRIDSFKLGEECADLLTHKVFNRKPIEMECENIYNPMILLMRKRYVGKKYEDPKNPFNSKSITMKGLAVKRRDYPPLIQNCLRGVIEKMTIIKEDSEQEQVVKECIESYYKVLDKIRNYDVELSDIITSATLKKDYANENLAHVHLFKRMQERKEDVQIGDRIQFVFFEGSGEKYELAEDPKYFKENGLKINRLFYTEKLAKVILGFYKNIFPDHINGILDNTNKYIKEYNGKEMKLSDFKMDEVRLN